MQNTSTDALILRVQERGATDRLLTLISATEGRFYAIVKGRSGKGKEAAALEPFTLSNFEFYEKNGFKWVKSATVTEAFPGIRYDTEKLFLAAYFADIVYELSVYLFKLEGVIMICEIESCSLDFSEWLSDDLDEVVYTAVTVLVWHRAESDGGTSVYLMLLYELVGIIDYSVERGVGTCDGQI